MSFERLVAGKGNAANKEHEGTGGHTAEGREMPLPADKPAPPGIKPQTPPPVPPAMSS